MKEKDKTWQDLASWIEDLSVEKLREKTKESVEEEAYQSVRTFLNSEQNRERFEKFLADGILERRPVLEIDAIDKNIKYIRPEIKRLIADILSGLLNELGYKEACCNVLENGSLVLVFKYEKSKYDSISYEDLKREVEEDGERLRKEIEKSVGRYIKENIASIRNLIKKDFSMLSKDGIAMEIEMKKLVGAEMPSKAMIDFAMSRLVEIFVEQGYRRTSVSLEDSMIILCIKTGGGSK